MALVEWRMFSGVLQPDAHGLQVQSSDRIRQFNGFSQLHGKFLVLDQL